MGGALLGHGCDTGDPIPTQGYRTIVRAERNYEEKRWVAYDRLFRYEALSRKSLDWSITDSRLSKEAFTGRAKTISRCSFCLQDDRTASQCPRNLSRALFGWLPEVMGWPQLLTFAGTPSTCPLTVNCPGSLPPLQRSFCSRGGRLLPRYVRLTYKLSSKTERLWHILVLNLVHLSNCVLTVNED